MKKLQLFLILLLSVQNYSTAQTLDNIFDEDCSSNLMLCLKAMQYVPDIEDVLLKSLEMTDLDDNFWDSFFIDMTNNNSEKILHQLNAISHENNELKALYINNRKEILENILLFQQIELAIKRTSMEEVLAFIYDTGFEEKYLNKMIELRGLDIESLTGFDVATTLSTRELDEAFGFIYQQLLNTDYFEKFSLLIKINGFESAVRSGG